MRKYLIALVALLASVAAKAQTVADFDKWYDLPVFNSAAYIVNVPAEGSLYIYSNETYTVKNAAGATQNDCVWNNKYGDDYANIYDVTAGTYTVTFGFVMNSGARVKFVFVSGDQPLPLTIESCSPAAGGTLSIGDAYIAEITFSEGVTFTSGTLTIGSCATNIYNFTDYNSLVSSGIFSYTEEGTNGMVNYNGNLLAPVQGTTICIPATTSVGKATSEHPSGYYNVIQKWNEAGLVATGDEVVITLHGIATTAKGTLYGEDGTLTLSFKLGNMPTSLVSAVVPEVLNSWYNPGDEGSVATFKFSSSISSAQATLSMGSADIDDYWSEELPVTIDGETITIDLSGKMRTYTTMGLAMSWPSYTLLLSQVIDTNGHKTFSEAQGSDASYAYTCIYKDVSAELSAEITPASGSTLSDSDKEIEIWMMNTDNLVTYDGVDITWQTTSEEGEIEVHSRFYALDELSIEVNGFEHTIICPITDEVRQAKDVRVSLNITSSRDGRSHPVVAYYNTALSYDWDIAMMADPTDGSELHILDKVYLTLMSTYAINTAKTITVSGDNYSGYATLAADGKTNAVITLPQGITAAGTYTISVPEGSIGDYKYGDSQFTSGTANSAFTLTYTVTGQYAGRDVVATPDDGETVDELSQIDLLFFNYSRVAPTWNNACAPYVELVSDDSDPVTYYGEFVDDETVDNALTFILDSTISSPGTYRFVLPKGSVANASTGDPIQTAYSFNYVIRDGDVVKGVTAVRNDGEVFDLQGRRVSGKQHGLYIQWGKKVLGY